MSKKTDEIKEAAEEKTPEAKEIDPNELLSTGSTLLNLACSQNPAGGFLKGHYYILIGDSKSGKTFLSITCFAEAARNPNFKDHRLIYDNSEKGCLIDIEKLFGKKTVDKIEPPSVNKDSGDPVFSEQIEDFYYHVDDAIQDGRPFIYVLDSMDALTSEEEIDKFDEHKKASRAGKDAPGSFTDGKAKKNSSGIRKLLGPLSRSGSILIIINQTRDNIGFGFEKKTRSGGHALRFYCTVEMWSSVEGAIKKTVKGKPRKIGTEIKVKIKKNRITGKEPEVLMPIYPSYGIDDIESCINYLISEGILVKNGNKIDAPEFKFKGTIKKLVDEIEEKGLEKQLQKLVGRTWNDIEEACALKRKKRYE